MNQLGSDKRKEFFGYFIYLIPGLILFIPIIIIPFISNIYISFTEWSGVGKGTFIGFENYINALKDRAFWLSFRNNLLLILAVTIIPTIIGLILAVVIYNFVAKRIGEGVANFFRAGYYLPQIVTIVASAIAWKWIYHPNWGAANTFLQSIGLPTFNWLGDSKYAMPSIMLMMMWFQIGYPLVIFMSALQRIDPQIFEAASLDGANWWISLKSITIPQVKPEIFVITLTAMIYALKIFGPIFAMTSGGPGQSTYVAGYFAYKNFFEKAEVGYGSAVSVILSLIIIILSVALIKLQSFMDMKEDS